MNQRLIHELLSEPYGPYLDSELLTGVCKSVNSRVVGLNSLMLSCGGKCIGLTQSEMYQPEHEEARVNKYGVLFRGVLTIESLDWLQPLAKKRLNKDIRERHVAVHTREGRRTPHERETPGLEHFYSKKTPDRMVKVIIQGKMSKPAGYLTRAKAVPHGLVIYTEDRDRFFEVITMDVGTYEHSRKYLGRYRALRVIEDIVKLDKEIHRASNEAATPKEQRTPEWFAEMYKKHMANPAISRRRRIVYISDDSDIEPDTGGHMKDGREHVLRHVPTAEILSLLATHAEWFLQDQRIRKRSGCIDVDVWGEWVRRSRRARKEAYEAGVRWGWFDDADANGPLESDGDDEDDESDEERVVRPRKRKQTKSKQTRPTKRQSLGSTAPISRSTTQTNPLFYPEEDEEQESWYGQNVYDPDDSEPSSQSASDWDCDESLPSRSTTPVDPEIMGIIPKAVLHPPMIPFSTFIWICPVKGCYYEIPMLGLNEEQYSQLLPEDIARLKRGGWNLHEPWVQSAFKWLVSVHYCDHLDKLGVVLRKEGERTRLEWKNPKIHQPSASRTRRPIERPDSDGNVKVEQPD